MAQTQSSDFTTSSDFIGAKEKSDESAKAISNNIERAGASVKSATKEFNNWAADSYHNAQDYVRKSSLSSATSDLKELSKRHPLKAAAVGVGIGFLLGKLFRRN